MKTSFRSYREHKLKKKTKIKFEKTKLRDKVCDLQNFFFGLGELKNFFKSFEFTSGGLIYWLVCFW